MVLTLGTLGKPCLPDLRSEHLQGLETLPWFLVEVLTSDPSVERSQQLGATAFRVGHSGVVPVIQKVWFSASLAKCPVVCPVSGPCRTLLWMLSLSQFSADPGRV